MTESSARQCLEAARLRPTAARIGVLQTLRSAEPEVLCTEALFRLMLQRGVRASAGTAYRAVRKLLAHGVLEREWDDQRRAVYRIAAPEAGAMLRLVCRDSGRSIALDDADLHARLMAAAQSQGLRLSAEGIAIYVGGHGPAEEAGEAPSPHAPTNGARSRLDSPRTGSADARTQRTVTEQPQVRSNPLKSGPTRAGRKHL